jgi:hypothetical protein
MAFFLLHPPRLRRGTGFRSDPFLFVGLAPRGTIGPPQADILMRAPSVSADFLPNIINFGETKRNRRAAKQKRTAMRGPLVRMAKTGHQFMRWAKFLTLTLITVSCETEELQKCSESHLHPDTIEKRNKQERERRLSLFEKINIPKTWENKTRPDKRIIIDIDTGFETTLHFEEKDDVQIFVVDSVKNIPDSITLFTSTTKNDSTLIWIFKSVDSSVGIWKIYGGKTLSNLETGEYKAVSHAY